MHARDGEMTWKLREHNTALAETRVQFLVPLSESSSPPLSPFSRDMMPSPGHPRCTQTHMQANNSTHEIKISESLKNKIKINLKKQSDACL